MAPSDPLHRRMVRPLQEFLQESTASAVLLLIAALVALVWVNSPIGDSYERLWRTTFTLGSGRWAVSHDLRHWVNDGLMALFFLVVGLEIKREFLSGELRDRRTAALPVIAAVAGMAVPALIYLAINAGGDGARGWGIAMPTDIAFTLGILALASKNAPPGLRSFVLTLAIVDDILTFVVIAIFYPTELDAVPLLVAALLVAAMVVLPRLGIRPPLIYVGLGVGVWVAMNASGVPAALAGVVVGLVTPAVPIPRRRGPVPDDAIAPLARVEHLLLPWASFVILPLFALANAGVRLSATTLTDALHSPVSVGIVVARIVGKVVGIGLAAWVATRLGVRSSPRARGSRTWWAWPPRPPSRSRCRCSWPTWRSWTRPGSSARRRWASWRVRHRRAIGYLLLRAAGRRYSETD